MQIDGHHTITYVAARSAGFSHDEAITIAYAAQYVDDATNAGPIIFKDSAYLYSRIASAHSMIDYNNLFAVKNHLAWLPFHFLPGNGSLPSNESPNGNELAKLICRPDSHVARDMLRYAIKDKGKDREFHRLGITMHVYADTFAHQGFVGACSKANNVDLVNDNKELKAIRKCTTWEMIRKVIRQGKNVTILFLYSCWFAFKDHESVIKYWRDFLGRNPLGHAEANTYPDQPYLTWSYKNWQGETIHRDNPSIFIEALQQMTRAMQAWRAGDDSMELEKYKGIPSKDLEVAEKLIRTVTDPDGEVRHERWLAAIRNGEFSFGPVELKYNGKGEGSWKEKALGTVKEKDSGHELYRYSSLFLESDWKHFHDALQVHRSDVVHEILPKYGICAA